MSGAAQEPERRRGIVEAVFAAYPRFRASMARQLEERPEESRLLAYVMGVCLALFLGRLPALLYAPQGSLEGGLAAHVTMALVSILFFLPLFLYGVAALVRVVARAFGGTGGWYETRLATFWALLVAAPLQLTAALTSNALSLAGPSTAGLIASLAAGVAAAWIWAACLAEAHGFRHTGAVFAAMFVALNGAFLLIVLLTGA